MLIQDLAIPQNLKQKYARGGILELYPPQIDCVDKGLLDGKNLHVAIPTASGKTLIAEMAMHQTIFKGGKCLYIVPLKALASEKFEEFGNKGVKVGIATGDFDRRDDLLGKNDIIVATSEKVDSLLRNSATWISEITLLVIDEVHLIDSQNRGPTLEMVIAKMRFRNPDMQIIGLSATIGNPDKLASWLNAELVTSTWRPVDLRPGVFFNDCIHFRDGTRTVKAVSKNYDDINLTLDTITEGGQCLIFVSSRRNAEAFAKRAASAIKSEDPELAVYAERIRKSAETDMGKLLAACVTKGAAFHHAGLSRPERSVVEEGFRKGLIKCISSTPTLAAGLNLPPTRVTELRSVLWDSASPLYTMMRYYLGWVDVKGEIQPSPGKMSRPTLCLLACEAAGGDWHSALPAAAAVELIHNFSLIHDDIQDGSWERRHSPTVWKVWGEAQAINAGDAMYVLAQLALFRLDQEGIPLPKIILLSTRLNQASLQLCEGQYLDIEFERHLDITVDQYLDMIDKKTAALFAASLYFGALLGTDRQNRVSLLSSFGQNLGMAYQVQNDLQGIWGEEESGKAAPLLLFGSVGIGLYGWRDLAALDVAAVSATAWWTGAFIVLLPTVAAYFLIYWALARAESSMVALYVYLQPVIAGVLSAVFLGERVTATTLAGAALIFAAVSWTAWGTGAFIVLFPTVAAYFLIYWALARTESSTVALYIVLQPVIAGALSAAFLGERLTETALLGALVIVAAVVLATRSAPVEPPILSSYRFRLDRWCTGPGYHDSPVRSF